MQGISAKLPEGVSPRLGPDATGVGWVFQYALVDHSGTHTLADLRSFQDWYLRYWLSSVEGVAEVASVGGFVKQYQVEINPATLLAYQLPLHQVIDAIRKSNNDVGGRLVEFTGTEYMVNGRGYVRSVEDIEKIVVGTNGQRHADPRSRHRARRAGPRHPTRRRRPRRHRRRRRRHRGDALRRERLAGHRARQSETRRRCRSRCPPGVEVVATYDRSS